MPERLVDPRLTPAERDALAKVLDRALDAALSSGRNGIAAAILTGYTLSEIAENEVNALMDPTRLKRT